MIVVGCDWCRWGAVYVWSFSGVRVVAPLSDSIAPVRVRTIELTVPAEQAVQRGGGRAAAGYPRRQFRLHRRPALQAAGPCSCGPYRCDMAAFDCPPPPFLVSRHDKSNDTTSHARTTDDRSHRPSPPLLQMMMKEQDQGLEELGSAVDRVGRMADAMNQELNLQNRCVAWLALDWLGFCLCGFVVGLLVCLTAHPPACIGCWASWRWRWRTPTSR